MLRQYVARACAVTGIVAAAVALLTGGGQANQRQGLEALHVPPGFKVEKVAGNDLTAYPMMATIDDRGRLFLCESSGNNITNAQMKANPEFRLNMLEDTNGDGVYDKNTVFAEKLTLPAGAVWHRGSLYVAAPPDLLRFTDTDGDGKADQREIVVTGWNLSSNAASLHGPIMGPDGMLYLTDGRHGFNIQSKEGKVYKGMASRIWRVNPDGSGLEWMAGGGFDNPVEVVFTPSGETIGTMTYFVDPRDGQRDALLHFVEGGVYPKWYSVVSEFKRTGDLMPVMTKFARIAPSGLLRYQGAALGAGYDGNLFSAQFNPHRVQRHVLSRDGATFRTEDSDFLTSIDPDFHPTDVLEDPDGSLLVVDTGAWFIHGCPISRVSKPEFKGGIYRIRRTGAPRVQDPLGRKLNIAEKQPGELGKLLSDARWMVRDLALDRLVQAGDAAISVLAKVRESAAAYETRCAAVFGLGRIATPQALEMVRAALRDPNFRVRIAAARVAGMAHDAEAVSRLMQMVKQDAPPVRRQAATALGLIGDPSAVPTLLAAAAGVTDRFIEHSIIYSLIHLGSPATVSEGLKHRDPEVRKSALIALDQMDGAPLRREQFTPFLSDTDKNLRAAALWVVAHHPEWSGDVMDFLNARLHAPAVPASEMEPVREALLSFCSADNAQSLISNTLGEKTLPASRRMFLLEVMDRCALKEFPQSWVERIGEQLDAADPKLRLKAAAMIRARNVASMDDRLERIAAGPAPDDLRTLALSILVSRRPLDAAGFRFLTSRLDPKLDASLRLSAAQVLGRAKLSPEQLLALARTELPRADALVMPNLLDAFRTAKGEEIGHAIVRALLKASNAVSEADGKRVQELMQNFPESVRAGAKPLVARFVAVQKERLDRLRKLEPLLTASGDIGRGRRIFFGEKVNCASCHTIGAEGGHVGPDLTAVGAIRSGHDLLEAIVFPSASFVPGHEVYRVETATEVYSGVRGDGSSGAVVLVTGPRESVRIPRDKIISMKPSTVSLMPEGFADNLTPAEFADLLAFLQAQKSRETALAQR